jgi:uncharacterized small protein (DUF1192 family)
VHRRQAEESDLFFRVYDFDDDRKVNGHLGGREPIRSVARLRLLEIHELEKRAAMLGDEDLALEMRQAWKQACDRAVAVFGMSMLDQPRPPKLPQAL